MPKNEADTFGLIPRVVLLSVAGVATVTMTQLAPVPVFAALKPFHITTVVILYLVALALIMFAKPLLTGVSPLIGIALSLAFGAVALFSVFIYLAKSPQFNEEVCSAWSTALNYRLDPPTQSDGFAEIFSASEASERTTEELQTLVNRCRGNPEFTYQEANLLEVNYSAASLVLVLSYGGIVLPIFLLISVLGTGKPDSG